MRKFDAHALVAAMHGGRDYAVPKGWSTIEQIRAELGLAHTRNASTRARDLWGRGLLERMAHQSKANTGQCHMSYVYRVKQPWRSFAHAAENFAYAVKLVLPYVANTLFVSIVEVAFEDGGQEQYFLPLAVCPYQDAKGLAEQHPQAVLASITTVSESPSAATSSLAAASGRQSTAMSVIETRDASATAR